MRNKNYCVTKQFSIGLGSGEGTGDCLGDRNGDLFITGFEEEDKLGEIDSVEIAGASSYPSRGRLDGTGENAEEELGAKAALN